MPILILSLLVTITCAVHVFRTGRPYWWFFVLLAAPWLGAAVYFLVEILPELRQGRAARGVKADISRLIDPDRDYRAAANDLEDVETVATLTAMAEQLMARERYGQAAALLARCLAGPHEHDPDILLRLAEARFLDDDHVGALAALDEIQAHHPGYRSETGHLIYARALEGLGQDARALEAYENLAGYATGEEPRVRCALLLQKAGRVDEARSLFQTVVRNVERASKVYASAQREWYQVARANL